jgi:phosphoribosylformimino-5-aminoimidazole carboxamide ribotide isomerase
MRIIPVMDLKGGLVVHAVGGRRHEYQPIRSVLVDSCQPAEVAKAFQEKLGLGDLYVADLDAIGGQEPALDLLRSLADLGLKLRVDAGVRTVLSAKALAESGATSVIAGLETVGSPEFLEQLVSALGSDAVWFSLDLKQGVALGDLRDWPSSDPLSIASRVLEVGIRRMIVLDLARVGKGSGIGTEELCRRLRGCHEGIELIAGGGVRHPEDLATLEELGLSGVLVGTALHNGSIGAIHTSRTGRSSPQPRS